MYVHDRNLEALNTERLEMEMARSFRFTDASGRFTSYKQICNVLTPAFPP